MSTISSSHEDTPAVIHGSPQSVGDDSDDAAKINTKPKCLIGCTGSVATLKVPELVVELSELFDVMVACTGNASFFLEKSMTYNPDAWNKFELLGGWNLVLKDEDGEQNIHVMYSCSCRSTFIHRCALSYQYTEWNMWNMIGNSVLHIEMRRWADVMGKWCSMALIFSTAHQSMTMMMTITVILLYVIVVAPASANVLSKAAFGITDNFVLSIMRAWDFEKPCILCPAMNTFMWTHPATKDSIGRLKAFGWEVLGPVEKLLACNEVGNGAMVSVQAIKDHLVAEFFPSTSEGKAKTTTGISSRRALLAARGSDHDCDTTAETSGTSKNPSLQQGSTTSTTAASPAPPNTFSRRATKELLQLPTNSFLARNLSPGGVPVTGPVHHSLLMPLPGSQTSNKAVSPPPITMTAPTSRGLSGSRVPSSDGGKGLSLNTLLLSNLITGVGVGLGLAGAVLLYGVLTGERITDIVPRSLRTSIPRYSI